MVAWLKSLRLPICLLAGLLTVAGFRLGDVQMSWLLVMAVVLISCSTMLQNDWRDRYHDIYKGKVLALQHPRAFLALLLAFWVVVCGLIVVVAVGNSNVGGALAILALAGLIYSETRRIPMVPVTLVALTSGSPALLPIMAGADASRIWLLFLSATLVIFGREITKDIDDHCIDGGYKWTIPLALGNKWAKAISVAAIVFGLAVAVQISMAVLPVSLLSLVGVIMLQPRITKIIIDVGVALSILILIFIG